MNKTDGGSFTSYPFPLMRHATRDVLRAAAKKPMIHALVEIDVTEARRRLREIRRVEGEAISFTGFVVACCASAVDRNPGVQGYRGLGNKLVVFEDVDVSLPTERTVDGWSQVVPMIIRQANRKPVRQIHREIRAAQASGAFPSRAIR